LERVGTRNARCLNLDQDVAVCRLRNRHFVDVKNVGSAVLA
jgi:hypothetical protein